MHVCLHAPTTDAETLPLHPSIPTVCSSSTLAVSVSTATLAAENTTEYSDANASECRIGGLDRNGAGAHCGGHERGEHIFYVTVLHRSPLWACADGVTKLVDLLLNAAMAIAEEESTLEAANVLIELLMGMAIAPEVLDDDHEPSELAVGAAAVPEQTDGVSSASAEEVEEMLVHIAEHGVCNQEDSVVDTNRGKENKNSAHLDGLEHAV
ncbi:hypothetical protein EVG20_g9136 [Dentipellis fragilis]|uniref:Uncharacterized protein n=1 Tax=Dentipellis fragilis TaxID=205917 RepID=A0A4Y9Y3E9_9AGAM|nr:hypothetical protein EVG20_g9136 [Dentipellis fragilis]